VLIVPIQAHPSDHPRGLRFPGFDRQRRLPRGHGEHRGGRVVADPESRGFLTQGKPDETCQNPLRLRNRATPQSVRTEVGRRRLHISTGYSAAAFRKEVIQPQVLLRLPCYDFTPIMSHTLGACPLAVSGATSSTAHFRDVTGGVYKARERIHGAVLMRHY
jgi:hypothetical protein